MATVIALEGGVCAGKSTLGAILERKHGTISLPDYMDLLPGIAPESISARPPLERAETFMKLDATRLGRALGSDDRVLLDRSVLTVLAFEYACAATGRNGTEPRMGELLRAHNVLVPQAVIFLDVSDAARAEREKARGMPVLPILLAPAFNDAIRDFFRQAATVLPVEFFDSEAHSAEEIASKVRPLFERMDYPESVSLGPLVSWAFGP